ncbi:nucleotidyltransferase domain-containing protein [Candidatus Symbiopectobacterium sp. NZEC135]|uniref:nucleotidyltransferase domain-containing protein n=1 Tax=Candidatus Symbiopectobacterium sp. NZEC135 TaxID=2820471 RepID=UPI002226C359|nr:nucleotidyltransferase domain-containing protein [Candidatus Symbiopectobacterium sp. NZEC135]MCW2479098.1 nucleotidyltransferase domain-containing protein [Candidatus Symbiopectobacterium sp. NZEC135]
MNQKTDARTQYFCTTAKYLFGDNLSGIAETDAFLRQPDYSSRAVGHYYLIVQEDGGEKMACAAQYLHAEFPELSLNYLTERELADYPAHGRWSFHICPWPYRSTSTERALAAGEPDYPDALRQAAFATTHIARLYYLRDLPAKAHVWGVRQLGWAMRYAENGLSKLLGQLETRHHNPLSVAGMNKEDIRWLTYANSHWQPFERSLLENANTFRTAAARLSAIAECYTQHIAASYPDTQNVIAQHAETAPAAIHAMTAPIVDALNAAFGDRLLSLYLYGSAAHGDMRPNSDIDLMAVFDSVDHPTLEQVRRIQHRFEKLSLCVYSLNNIRQYPTFRRYGLLNGTRHLAGPFCFAQTRGPSDNVNAILNNLSIIRQVARGYLVSGCYGQRAHYQLSLMVKLADHGCLRPLQQWQSLHYPTNRAEAITYFSSCEFASALLEHAARLTTEEEALRTQLMAGNRQGLTQHWLRLNTFANRIENVVRPCGHYPP